MLGAFFAVQPWTILAQERFVDAVGAELSSGSIASAQHLARARLAADASDREAAFALGTADFLAAIEGLAQDLYRFGFTTDRVLEIDAMSFGMARSRLFPMPIAPNPAPEPISYDALRQVIVDFQDRLMQAEATLTTVAAGPVVLPLDLAKLRLDINRDGTGAEAEQIGAIIESVIGLAFPNGKSAFNFDESDVLWLRGYCHLLAAMTDILLAYDWHEAFEATAFNFFPHSLSHASALAEEQSRQLLRLTAPSIAASFHEVYGYYSDDARDPLYREWAASEAGRAWLQARHDQNALGIGAVADMAALVHLARWPVADPARLRSAREHLLRMIALSRENWASIAAETDDMAEWVPGPHQTSWTQNLVVRRSTVEGWIRFLDQSEGVLEGRLLLPHWRFDRSRGLNLRRMFEEPLPLDLIMLLQGRDAVPYFEEGPLAEDATANTAMSLLSEGFLAYFIWFN